MEVIPHVRGHLYRLRSRNLPYGVYDGDGGFIGIRHKFGEQFLDTEFAGATAFALEDLGPVPEGVPAGPEGHLEVGSPERRALYDFLEAAECAGGGRL